MAGLGERFRAAREARGLSLSEVSEQIRIRSVYLAAIEEERWSAIGAPVYIRGFLRTYARFLGLDPEEIVADFNAVTAPAQTGEEPETEPERAPIRSSRRGKSGSVLVWTAALVAVLLVAFVVYNELTMRRESGNTVAGASAAPAATANDSSSPGAPGSGSPGPSLSPGAVGTVAGTRPSPAGGAPAAAGPNTLALVFSAPTWLRVTVDGSVSMEGTFPAGTTKTFRGRKALVRLGNAGGVEIYVDGKNVGRLGKSGDVVERAFTL